MEVLNGYSFLILSRDDLHSSLRVEVTESISETLRKWSSSTRISPVFCLSGDSFVSPKGESFSGTHWVFFICKLHPESELLSIVENTSVWLTLGLFNAVLSTSSDDERRRIVAWLTNSGTVYETWTVTYGEVVDVDFSAQTNRNDSPFVSLSELKNDKLPSIVKVALDEYCPLAASTLARAYATIPEICDDLIKNNNEVKRILETLKDGSLHETAILGSLLYLNAALSRFSSQTFTGTSPISEKECHFASHSLLGVGIASLGLSKFCRFIEATLGEERIPDRFAMFEGITDGIPDLMRLDPRDPFWTKDHLGVMTLSLEQPDEVVPILAYFSARDGFKSRVTNISAPLACVSCCNVPQWSLLTLTHEISHIIIKDVLGILYPDYDSDADVEHALGLLEAKQPAGNLLDEIRRYLLAIVITMDYTESGNNKVDFDVELLKDVLLRWHPYIEETIAHAFDLLYFYGRNIQRYVEGIWLSWGAIPNVRDRIRDYVTRTITVATVPDMQKEEAGLDIAKEKVYNCLQELKNKVKTSNYISDAIQYLDRHWEDEIKGRVLVRRMLVKIVMTFLFSERSATVLRNESELKGPPSDKGGYTLHPLKFEGKLIRNPVLFLSEYTKSKEISPALSAWIFYVLAFYVDKNE